MSIFYHFQHLTLNDDQSTALEKIESFLNSDSQVFILKGYAGSGKTTILKGLVTHLKATGKDFAMLAPTGRAAKVLRDRTGRGMTIHRGIYNFEKLQLKEVESEDVAEKSFHYYFPIKDEIEERRVIIVDEASMIAEKKVQHELFTFGTGKLLSDLLTYSKIKTSQNKIIFVGDPAQLPPVTDPTSLAFEKSYFEEHQISVAEAEMKTVMRQAAENPILHNASKFRDLMAHAVRTELELDFDNKYFIKANAEEIAESYTNHFPLPEVGNGVVISFSNAQCLSYNKAIREKIFPNCKDIVAGDVILINNNNYHTYGTELYNGDMAKVIAVSERLETQSAPVYVTEGREKVKKTVTLTFRDIVIKLPNHPEDIKCKVFDNLLNNTAADLSITELKALYINFIMRFNEEQRRRKEQGLPTFREGSEEFRNQLKADPYYNALRIKYGYAITCHKSQGGEWDTVFVDYYGRTGLRDAQLRWSYTAVTRAKDKCYNINPPCFTAFSKLAFAPIGPIGKVPIEAIQFNNIPLSPFHAVGSHACKSLKYHEIADKIADTSFSLDRVETRPHLEIYYFNLDGKELRAQAFHDGAGIFSDFVLVGAESEEAKSLLFIINQPYERQFRVDYTPSHPNLEKLYSIVQAGCDIAEVAITNIIELPAKYYVTYYLRTSGISSYIQFYFNGKAQLTKAISKSVNGEQDDKLKQLVNIISQYAS
ncbi:AAA family ATPase [uncultured Pontibacter sp.]|uniref:ATP-dependent DNA helicase n=1 Tax=uncultured Pontibacter sp. TaxID=453356 RepID=UPI00261887A4|nr:AAA family ATPase [uncultured Pontibacter sp.]